MERVKALAKSVLPEASRRWLRQQQRRLYRLPAIRRFGPFGHLRRVKPFRPLFGSGYGQCIDRYYIEKFLSTHQTDVRGRVLEVGDNAYTLRFGGARVVRSDVLHVRPDNPEATIVADLTHADDVIPSQIFDCVILTQTLEVIYDFRAALRTVCRILKPGGVLLATFPGIRHISRHDMEAWGEYWRFTTLSASKFFTEAFGEAGVTVEAYGNVLAAVGFLHGIVTDELSAEELDYYDPDYELLIAVRVIKSTEGSPYNTHPPHSSEVQPR
jgi:SAM-dependent methyltransferase